MKTSLNSIKGGGGLLQALSGVVRDEYLQQKYDMKKPDAVES